MLYICPKCHEELTIVNNSYKCINNHSYDILAKGYVNFLLNNDKNSIHPGDSKESLIARYDYLNKGYYSFIFNKVNNIVKQYNNIDLLDIGCGVGYYTYQLKKENPSINIYGFDIAKEALAIATRYTKSDINWFVSNSKNIPIKNNSVDIVLAMFSFVTPSEIERVLKNDGVVIQVCAGKNHLIELKKEIYTDIKEKEQTNTLLPFNLIEQQEHTTNIIIDNNEDILNLFKMTPHYYRTSEDNRDKISKLDRLDLTIDVVINIYKI